MPYRFKIDEPVEKGFRRIAREQVDLALNELAAPHVGTKGVHECRKTLKRLRALVRLAAPSLGKKMTRQRGKALSKIAHLLAARRDEAVMLETIAKISKEDGATVTAVLQPLRAYLVAHVGDGGKPLEAESASTARLLLLQEAKKFARLRFKGHGYLALEEGLEASYRGGRKAMRKAYSEATDENFHALRKTVQWHWRQMSLLSRAWPDEFAVRAGAARELSQILGDDHDIAMLIEAAVRAPDLSHDEKDGIVALCQRRQTVLRDAAEFRAERLFAEAPSAFVKRIGAYWKYGRVRDPRPHAESGPALVHHDGTGAAELRTASKPKAPVKALSSAPSQRRA